MKKAKIGSLVGTDYSIAVVVRLTVNPDEVIVKHIYRHYDTFGDHHAIWDVTWWDFEVISQ